MLDQWFLFLSLRSPLRSRALICWPMEVIPFTGLMTPSRTQFVVLGDQSGLVDVRVNFAFSFSLAFSFMPDCVTILGGIGWDKGNFRPPIEKFLGESFRRRSFAQRRRGKLLAMIGMRHCLVMTRFLTQKMLVCKRCWMLPLRLSIRKFLEFRNLDLGRLLPWGILGQIWWAWCWDGRFVFKVWRWCYWHGLCEDF